MLKKLIGTTLAALFVAGAVLAPVSFAGARNVFTENHAHTIFSEGKTPNKGYVGMIRDDVIPDPDNTREQFTVYADETGYAYIGYEFFEPFTANTLIWTSGAVTAEGGWFADGDIHVEVFAGGIWTEIEAFATPEYPVSADAAAFTSGMEYVFNFKPVFIDGIRIRGKAGGTDAFITCGELNVLCDVDLGEYDSLSEYMKASDADSSGWIQAIGHPIAAVTDPDVSGGSKRLKDINDGYIPGEGDSYGKQFDTVHSKWKEKPGHEEYLGYIFDQPQEIELIEFTEGGNFYDGGWFRNGTLRVEIYENFQWKEVGFTSMPEYPDSDDRDDFLPDFETYTFRLDAPVTCNGVRIAGEAGGSAYFISCGELRVKKVVEEKKEFTTTPIVQKPVEDMTDEMPEEKPAEEISVKLPLIIFSVVCITAAVVILVIISVRTRKK